MQSYNDRCIIEVFMNIIHLKPENFKTSCWSGGKTTELYLYPEIGSYARRDFQVRISSATVELAESDFTPLPGVERYITPLQGSFTLYQDGRVISLSPLSDPYRFSGDTPTHCIGTATDFNLMLRGCDGEMALSTEQFRLRPGLNALYPPADTCLTLGAEQIPLHQGELLVVFAEAPAMLTFPGKMLTCYANISP